MRKTTVGELAIKTYVLTSSGSPEFNQAARLIKQQSKLVSLTEAPEDAICSLVLDLMRYCEREKIDWNEDVMSRAAARFRTEHPEPQKQ